MANDVFVAPFVAVRAFVLLVFLAGRSQTLLLKDNIRRQGVDHDSAESCSVLANQGTHYTVEVNVGSPPQKFDLVADTGSIALIVESCECQKQSLCKPTEKCFVGDDSLSYVGPKPTDPLLLLKYGTGDIIASAATDVVQVGEVSTKMKSGVLLMVKRMFMTEYDFEGLLGLGVPSWAGSSKSSANSSSPSLSDDNLKAGMRVRPRSFLETAGVMMFSMCFRPGLGGALRLNSPAAPRMLKQVGRRHWSLNLNGISAGSPTAPVSICDRTEPGHSSPCAAIPDSGTTNIMGPKKDIERIFADICARWPRCQKFAAERDISHAEAFKHVLWDCPGWMTPEEGVGEVPSVFFHLGGTDGETETVEITAMSYVYESTSAAGHRVCLPSFDTWQFDTKIHGPACILGTPLFYEYQVTFGLEPPSIGFSKEACHLCDDQTTSLALSNKVRIMNGKPRLPNIDVREGL